jgi:hypothetical protein
MRKRLVEEIWPPLKADDAAATIPMPWPTRRWKIRMKRRSKNLLEFGLRYFRLIENMSAITVNSGTVDPSSGGTYASCRIPTVVRRSGDNPILEMRVAVELDVPFLSSLVCMADPTTLRVQKMKRYPQPSTPCMPWRKMRYTIGRERAP